MVPVSNPKFSSTLLQNMVTLLKPLYNTESWFHAAALLCVLIQTSHFAEVECLCFTVEWKCAVSFPEILKQISLDKCACILINSHWGICPPLLPFWQNELFYFSTFLYPLDQWSKTISKKISSLEGHQVTSLNTPYIFSFLSCLWLWKAESYAIMILLLTTANQLISPVCPQETHMISLFWQSAHWPWCRHFMSFYWFFNEKVLGFLKYSTLRTCIGLSKTLTLVWFNLHSFL